VVREVEFGVEDQHWRGERCYYYTCSGLGLEKRRHGVAGTSFCIRRIIRSGTSPSVTLAVLAVLGDGGHKTGLGYLRREIHIFLLGFFYRR
jgi:hypothetical protein